MQNKESPSVGILRSRGEGGHFSLKKKGCSMEKQKEGVAGRKKPRARGEKINPSHGGKGATSDGRRRKKKKGICPVEVARKKERKVSSLTEEGRLQIN